MILLLRGTPFDRIYGFQIEYTRAKARTNTTEVGITHGFGQ